MNKTNRKWISQIVACSFLAMLPIGAYAQNNKTIHGVVKDANGETIIGASVGQKGTKNATVTNLDGEFSISVPDNAVLEISYIGYNNQRVAVGGKSSLEIVLTEDVHKLNELVVVGYGVMKKKDLTGAVGSLAAKDIENSPVANIGQAIQGKIAGLQVVDAGKPGDNVTIKVRGMGSINNCDPLVVIDGVPTDLGINTINMADVERLDVLKDASATAIYGSRGANGVIMITTKKGKEGKGHLSLSANLAVQNATRTPDLLNASQYAALSNDMMNNSGNTANPEWTNPSALGKGTDWVDELFRTGYNHQEGKGRQGTPLALCQSCRAECHTYSRPAQCKPVCSAEQRHDEQFGQHRQSRMDKSVGSRQRNRLGRRVVPYRIYAELHVELFGWQRQGTLLCVGRYARSDGYCKKRQVPPIHLPAEL